MHVRSLIAAALVASLALPLLAEVQAQQSVGRDVGMQLSARQTTIAAGEQVQVDLFVTNPSKRSLTSVELLLSYDPAALRGVSVAYPQDTPFEMNLLSTGESEFDATAGQVRMSRATLKDTSLLPDTNYPFATMTFEATAGGATTLDFVKTLNGLERVAANATVEGISTNIANLEALTPLSLTISGTRNSAASTGNSNTNTATSSTVTNIFSNANTNVSNTNTNAVITTNTNLNSIIPAATNTNTNFATLSNTNTNAFSTLSNSNMNTNATAVVVLDAPRDVAIKKVGKQISLYWSNDDASQGTYIYYSTAPDSFKARKRVEYPNSTFTFSSMAAKGKHYFVLTHLDATGKESAYTPVFIVDGATDGIYYENDSYLTKVTDRGVLGARNVETMGLSDKARASLAAVPSMPENGPAEMLILLLLLSLGGAAYFSMRGNNLTV